MRGGPIDFPAHFGGVLLFCVVRLAVDAGSEEEHELEFVVEFHGLAVVLGDEGFTDGGNSVGGAVC